MSGEISSYTQIQIVNHLENKSPTKYMYSFGKAPRFPLFRRNGSDMFYDLPSVRTKRTTGLGYGKRSDFTKNSKNQSEFISIKRDFDKGNLRGLKYSFGLGREKTNPVIPGYKLLDKNTPGPGSYSIIKDPGSESPHYSMLGRGEGVSENSSLIEEKSKGPGPGSYSSVIKISSDGRCPLSPIPNVKCPNFGASKTQRFFYKINNTPGPGQYKINGLLGSIYNSKYKSGKLVSIGKKLKDVHNKSDYPGPGAYTSFSEFGYTLPKSTKKSKVKIKKCLSMPKIKLLNTTIEKFKDINNVSIEKGLLSNTSRGNDLINTSDTKREFRTNVTTERK